MLVTGAAGGIGAALTETLARRGYRVYAAVRTGGGHLKADRGLCALQLDVTDPSSVRAAATAVRQEVGERGLRAVVNNAGVIVFGPLELVPPPELERQLRVNVVGAATVMQEFLPLLRAGQGRVINISAPTARVAMPFAAPISASKAALESLSDAARVELAPWGVPVIVIVPGAIATAIFDKAATAYRAALAASDPTRVALYAAQMAAVAAAQARVKPSNPQSVADVVVRAIEAPRPRTRYVANPDARLAEVLAHLPPRPRDRVLARALGLDRVRVGAGRP